MEWPGLALPPSKKQFFKNIETIKKQYTHSTQYIHQRDGEEKRYETCVMEQKIVYNEDGEVRVLRGLIIKEDDHFIHVQRRDGKQRIGKQYIIRIEEGNNVQ